MKRKTNLVCSLAGAGLLVLAGVAQAITIPVSVALLGNGAPPSTLGGFAVAPIGADASAVGSSVNSVGGVGFNQSVLHDQIGNGWGTWSHGYAGNVYDTAQSANPLSLTLNLSAPVTAFYFYVESVNWETAGFSFTATAQDGASLSSIIGGNSGAAGFGFFSAGGNLISSITVTTTDADGFAIGEFGATVQRGVPDGGSTLIYCALGMLGLWGFKFFFRVRWTATAVAGGLLLASLVFSGGTAFGAIDPFTTQSGLIYMSIDGLGTTAASGTVRVVKPSGATVRSAYLLAASTGFRNFQIPNSAVTLSGAPVTWIASTNSDTSSFNYLANVTSIVKPILDAAAAGTNLLTIVEGGNTGNIDGEILVVIFDDPNQTAFTTAVLLFGAQKRAGDNFNVNLSNPINLSDPSLILRMSLGISFSFQSESLAVQFSKVYVNGQQLTQSAGGQDDGASSDGALITVGGIGDIVNKAPPTQTVTNFNTDNELYSLIPFVTNGATSITVSNINPSGDDNIFFAALVLSGGAVINEGILLTPNNATNAVGTSHTVTAAVQDNNGKPVVGRTVNFTVVSGPNVGATGSAVTGADGKGSFIYVDSGGAGLDDIQASMIGSSGKIITSNDAFKSWVVACSGPVLTVTPKANRGYYLLTASNPCDVQQQRRTKALLAAGIYVQDNASAFLAGPYASGTIVKIKKSAATGTGSGTGVASVTIKVIGSSATIYAVDGNGTQSAPVKVLSL